MEAVDNTPQSLLFFQGVEAVHGLYDTLFNHRCVLMSRLVLSSSFQEVSVDQSVLMVPNENRIDRLPDG
jgi:hypothetical protein